MKQYLTFAWSIAALAILACPVMGSKQKRLRGSKPLEQEDNMAAGNDGVARRHNRVLARDLKGKPSVVQGKLGKVKKGKSKSLR
jgi:hypothetical protein